MASPTMAPEMTPIPESPYKKEDEERTETQVLIEAGANKDYLNQMTEQEKTAMENSTVSKYDLPTFKTPEPSGKVISIDAGKKIKKAEEGNEGNEAANF